MSLSEIKNNVKDIKKIFEDSDRCLRMIRDVLSDPEQRKEMYAELEKRHEKSMVFERLMTVIGDLAVAQCSLRTIECRVREMEKSKNKKT